MTFFNKIEKQVNQFFSKGFIFWHVNKNFLSFGDDFRMIISSKNLIQNRFAYDKFFDLLRTNNKSEIRTFSTNLT